MLRRFARGGLPAWPLLVGVLVLAMTTIGLARQAATPTAKEVIARHVAAIGGEKAYKAAEVDPGARHVHDGGARRVRRVRDGGMRVPTR